MTLYWYEPDGRGHYDYTPEEDSPLSLDRESHIEGFLPEESTYIGGERRSELSRDYVCTRCHSEMYGDNCYVCGAPCKPKDVA